MVESTTALKNRIKIVLNSSGFEARCFQVSSEALDELAAAKQSPYSVIIASYMMPKIKGDEILKRAKGIAPKTERILIADVSELETLVNAVNVAGINACLTLPFTDTDLLHRVDHCCRQYEIVQKQEHFKRLTHYQNRQLFNLASTLKKKDALYLGQLDQKRKEIRILESRIRSAGGSLDDHKPILLQDILARRNIDFSPEAFGSQFLGIKDEIKHLLEKAASTAYITLKAVPYRSLPNPSLITSGIKGPMSDILPLVLSHLFDHKTDEPAHSVKAKQIVLDDVFEIRISNDKTEAYLSVKAGDIHSVAPSHVRQFLEKNNIINGVKQDGEIESWLYKAQPGSPPLVIAKTKAPINPKNSQIRYHFPTQFLHAGKVEKDGSINFQDRGDIPYVKEGALLANKTFPEKGSPGIDVFGKEIHVEDPVDLTFTPGPGARLSEDGTRIYALTSGQPHLDALGNISVCPEYQIKGDLGFETGNVNFDGNVIVNGSVKQGFKVICASLTAKEIHGAEIDITGDLNVSMGIVNTELVKVKGSVQAKFVHNSKINAFGDLIVQREILDSKIYLSGACIIENGLIANSTISAKMGIRAASIGTPSSKPSALTVGVDEHTNALISKLDAILTKNKDAIQELETEVEKLEKEDQSLHGIISKHAYVQDRAQLELKDIEKKMENLKASGNMAAYQKVANTVKEIRMNAKKAEEEINKGFDRQDEIANEIAQKTKRINELESHNSELSDEKKRLFEFMDRQAPHPEVKVGKKAESGTRLFAANSSLQIYNTVSKCSIREYMITSDGTGGIISHEMRINNL